METEARLESIGLTVSCPHSLGKLIEWKRIHAGGDRGVLCGPHSLGKLIEWKRHRGHFIKELKRGVSPHPLRS